MVRQPGLSRLPARQSHAGEGSEGPGQKGLQGQLGTVCSHEGRLSGHGAGEESSRGGTRGAREKVTPEQPQLKDVPGRDNKEVEPRAVWASRRPNQQEQSSQQEQSKQSSVIPSLSETGRRQPGGISGTAERPVRWIRGGDVRGRG